MAIPKDPNSPTTKSIAEQVYDALRESTAPPKTKNTDKEILKRKQLFRNIIYGGGTPEELAEALEAFGINRNSERGSKILAMFRLMRGVE